MSTDSRSSSPALLVPTPSTSTNVVGEALLASGDETETDSPPIVPWRTGADTPIPPTNIVYVGHTNWRAQHLPEGERRRVRRRVRRIKRHTVNEIGISRDFFLIIALCFVLACLLIVLLRPIALEILWYIDDSY
ncbi:hypothetical protein DFH09DRAFT_1299731 [Mycena vulgaris]|nr:hypothetical protein DFH09DRAFT_1299731 [Mycena vulgaris]